MSELEHQKEARAKAIYFRAIDREPGRDRDAFVEGACSEDPLLYEKVIALLRANAEDSFLESPAIAENETIMDSVLESPGTMVGRYKVLQRIGEGGMGAVYMAEQTEPVSRKVALKIIKLGMDTKQVVARFEAERQALAMMDHPNIAKVLDAGATDNGRPFFVMELVRGVPITEYCDKNKLTTKERLELFIPVCQAIQHAHQKGIIHRDVKPSNVMVTLHDGNPVPKVIDFGIAKATNQKLTEKTLFTNYSQMIGTPAYMSPEQAEMSGLDVDTRTDVYSLGVLLYELLTGTTPFSSKELLSMGYGEMQRIISETEPPKPSTRMSTMQHEELTVTATRRGIDVSVLQKQFKGDLDWIVMKSLEKDRTHRYETVAELAADVTRHLNNETVNAAAPALSYQIQKLYQRQKKFIRAAVVIFLVFSLGIVGTTWQMIRANRVVEELSKTSIRADEVATFLDDLIREVVKQLGGNNLVALRILDTIDNLASSSLKTTPEAELITRYNLMQGYRTYAGSAGEKTVKQREMGQLLAADIETMSNDVPINKGMFRIWEIVEQGNRDTDKTWQELIRLGHTFSDGENPQPALALIAFTASTYFFEPDNTASEDLQIMKEALERAIQINPIDRLVDDTVRCHKALCSISIRTGDMDKALRHAEEGMKNLKKGVISNAEAYSIGLTSILDQASFLYLTKGENDKVGSLWDQVLNWWPNEQRRFHLHFKSGAAMMEVLQGRYRVASDEMFEIAKDIECPEMDFIRTLNLLRIMGDQERFEDLWQTRLIQSDATSSWRAKILSVLASPKILKSLNKTRRNWFMEMCGDEDSSGLYLLAKARWACIEGEVNGYRQSMDYLRQYEQGFLKNVPEWKAWYLFTKAKVCHLLKEDDDSKKYYGLALKILSEETLIVEVSNAPYYLGRNWLLAHAARREAEEAMGLPISPLESAFPPMNQSN